MRNLIADRALRHAAQVFAIEQHPPGDGIVKPRHQRKQRALAGPGAADKGDRFAGLNAEVDAAEDRTLFGVAESDVFKRDRADRRTGSGFAPGASLTSSSWSSTSKQRCAAAAEPSSAQARFVSASSGE